MFSRELPVSVAYGIGIAAHDREGRVITVELDACYVVCTYACAVRRWTRWRVMVSHRNSGMCQIPA